MAGGGEEEGEIGCCSRSKNSDRRDNVSNWRDGGGVDYRRGKMPAEISNWERLVDLVQAAFGEVRIVEDNTW